MFLRIVKARGGKGITHEYVRLVEGYREHGKNKQRVISNLGRKDVLGAHLHSLIELLRGEPGGGGGPPLGGGAGEPLAPGAGRVHPTGGVVSDPRSTRGAQGRH